MRTDRSLCEAVLAAVAEEEGVDATDLEPPLYEVIDPDALETLFRDRSGAVTFDYLGYRVTVDQAGDVALDGPRAERRIRRLRPTSPGDEADGRRRRLEAPPGGPYSS